MTSASMSPKKKQSPYINDNILESIRSIGSNVGKTVQQDVVARIPNDAIQDIIGTPRQTQQELKQRQEIDIPEKEENSHSPHKPDNSTLTSKDEMETRKKIDEIRVELQKLSQSVHGLHQEIETAVMEIPVNPGVYHLNFFEQLKSMMLSIREKVDDSRIWLAAWNGNTKKKRAYWGMYKKHGTTFGLSSERTLATQSG